MFFLLKDTLVANYADGTTPYIYGENIEELEQSPIFFLVGLKAIR